MDSIIEGLIEVAVERWLSDPSDDVIAFEVEVDAALRVETQTLSEAIAALTRPLPDRLTSVVR